MSQHLRARRDDKARDFCPDGLLRSESACDAHREANGSRRRTCGEAIRKASEHEADIFRWTTHFLAAVPFLPARKTSCLSRRRMWRQVPGSPTARAPPGNQARCISRPDRTAKSAHLAFRLDPRFRAKVRWGAFLGAHLHCGRERTRRIDSSTRTRGGRAEIDTSKPLDP